MPGLAKHEVSRYSTSGPIRSRTSLRLENIRYLATYETCLRSNCHLAQDLDRSRARPHLRPRPVDIWLHPKLVQPKCEDLAIPKNWTHFILRKVRHLAALEISARPRRGHVRNLDLHEIQATSAISLCLRFGQARDLVTYEVWACLTPCLTCDLAAAATRLIRLLAHWRNEPKEDLTHFRTWLHSRFQPPRYNHIRDLAISENWAGSEYSSISSLAVSQTHGKLDLIPSPLLLNVCAIFLALWIAHFLSFTFSLNQHLLPTQIAWIITPASFSQSSGIDKQHRWYHALCKECNQCTSTLHYCEPSCTEPFLLFSEF
uniref:Uncharacterized protein n=1 Tax=Ascaris lumbricoides TaxID=6252 RepID=A0A0M3I3P5_ASCLU